MHRIVIVGGGFGGVSVARQLAKRIARKDIEIVLIDDREAHVYTPWLYEVATAMSPVRSENFVRRARRRASIPFFHFPGFRGIRIVQTRVTDITEDGSLVICANGTTFHADVVVVSVGSLTNDFGIVGVTAYASPLKTPHEAEAIAHRLRGLFQSIKDGKKERAAIVVVGAGANGVELVAEMAAVRERFVEARCFERNRVRIILCDSGAEPVSMFPESVRKSVARRLRNLGVEFFGKSMITRVEASEVYAGAQVLPFDLLVWSAGVKSRKEPGEVWGLPVNERGRICIDDTFLVQGKRNIFALGDAAARIQGERPDPQSAQAASAQAPIVAKNILALLDEQPLQEFSHKTWQTLLAVGGSYGVGRVIGIPFSGRIAFYIRRLVDLKYFLSVFPVHHAVILWYRGVEVYGKNNAPQA